MRPETILFANCESCTLQSSVYVPSEFHNSSIVILVEAPGENEAKLGRPLVGKAGELLDDIMAELGKARTAVNYINSCCCRPIKMDKGRIYNRQPTPDEIGWCNGRLLNEIEQIKPTAIVSMGQTPYLALGGKIQNGFRMADIAGTQSTFQDKYEVFYTYHPAFALYSGNKSTEDGNRIRKEIKQSIENAFKEKRKEIQLKLF
jgi:uracil-DNA glycosylase family 4